MGDVDTLTTQTRLTQVFALIPKGSGAMRWWLRLLFLGADRCNAELLNDKGYPTGKTVFIAGGGGRLYLRQESLYTVEERFFMPTPDGPCDYRIYIYQIIEALEPERKEAVLNFFSGAKHRFFRIIIEKILEKENLAVGYIDIEEDILPGIQVVLGRGVFENTDRELKLGEKIWARCGIDTQYRLGEIVRPVRVFEVYDDGDNHPDVKRELKRRNKEWQAVLSAIKGAV